MRKIHSTLWLTSLLCMCGHLTIAAEACPPAGFDRNGLLELKQRDFAIADEGRLNKLAIALLPCLADVDPKLRDGVAYEALAMWMRGGRISSATAIAIMESLLPWLASDDKDSSSVAQPFAALVLAEVARMDRIAPFMSDQQRSLLLTSATHYMSAIRDYRGFDAAIGWRHGVAHCADLLMQLAVNPKSTKRELDAMLDALASQIAPTGEHFYVYGEGDRLARPVFLIAQRGLHTEQEWRDWLAQRTAPAPMAQWSDAFQSQAGLAKRHNTIAFLNALYVYVRENGDAKVGESLQRPLTDAIKRLR